MPDGLTVSDEVKPPTNHVFVLTKQDGSRLFGHVMSFHEPVVDTSVSSSILGGLKVVLFVLRFVSNTYTKAAEKLNRKVIVYNIVVYYITSILYLLVAAF